MDSEENGAPRATRRQRYTHRQLTIGECIAIERYGRHLIEASASSVGLADVLDFIDRIGVCTTCGWPVHIHDDKRFEGIRLGVCAQWTRQR
jgi:hypothetical protein